MQYHAYHASAPGLNVCRPLAWQALSDFDQHIKDRQDAVTANVDVRESPFGLPLTMHGQSSSHMHGLPLTTCLLSYGFCLLHRMLPTVLMDHVSLGPDLGPDLRSRPASTY